VSVFPALVLGLYGFGGGGTRLEETPGLPAFERSHPRSLIYDPFWPYLLGPLPEPDRHTRLLCSSKIKYGGGLPVQPSTSPFPDSWHMPMRLLLLSPCEPGRS